MAIELKEIVYQSVGYVGMARAFDYLHVANDVLTEAGRAAAAGTVGVDAADTPRIRQGGAGPHYRRRRGGRAPHRQRSLNGLAALNDITGS